MSTVTDTPALTATLLSSLTVSGDLRTSALEHLRTLSLPGNKHEEYRHAPLTRALEKNFSFTATNPASTLSTVEHLLIPGLDAYVIVLVNDQYRADLSTVDASLITVEPLDENRHREHLATCADYRQDAFVAWNTAAWNNGLYIEVAANRILEKPVIVHRIHDTTAGEVKTLTRNLVVVGKSSEVTLIEKFDTEGPHAGFSNTVFEGIVHENASLNWYSLQADMGNRYQFGHTSIRQERNSRVNCYTFTLDGQFVRNNLQLVIDGENCEAHMYGLYLLKGDTLADNHTVVDHRKPHSFSNELYKGVLEGNSRGVFNGKIYVRPHAQKTNAFQSNRNILLSDKAIINTKPQLEIWADDVKCSHGCTTGQLDEEAMFYMRSRGIGEDTARAIMLYAFASEVLATIKYEPLREFMDALVRERLHNDF